MTKLTKDQQRVYDDVVPYIREEDEAEFARMLSLVRVPSLTCRKGPVSLMDSFMWAPTPQGQDYWLTLHFDIARANPEYDIRSP